MIAAPDGVPARLRLLLDDRARLRELVRYAAVGLFNAGTYLGVYAAGVLVGVPYLLAAVLAFCLSASLGYVLHEYWTFRGASPTLRGLVKWLATHSTATGVNLVLLAITVDVVGLDRILAQAVLLPVTPVATYLIASRWIFTRGAHDERPERDAARPGAAPVDPVGRA